jgi:glycosyltransferase involved in cell wall biosynthesis
MTNLVSVSVVVASGASGDFLPRCLASLQEQAAAQSAEVIVVDRCGGATRARIAREFPFVTVVGADLDHRPSVPELRKIGVERARGDVVAIIEEHCVAPPHWLQTIRTAFRDDDVVIGGPILDSDFDRIRDWVVYFSEYHNYLPPWPDGPRVALNGANIAYRRDALLRHAYILAAGYWETVLHPLLLAENASFRAVSQMGVHHSGPFDFGYYLRQRYLLSRAWGGTRRNDIPLGRRLMYLAGAPLFPFLLLTRIALRVVRSGQRVDKLVAALPLLFPVTVVYVWGEWLGYLLGPGRALEWVE